MLTTVSIATNEDINGEKRKDKQYNTTHTTQD